MVMLGGFQSAAANGPSVCYTPSCWGSEMHSGGSHNSDYSSQNTPEKYLLPNI